MFFPCFAGPVVPYALNAPVKPAHGYGHGHGHGYGYGYGHGQSLGFNGLAGFARVAGFAGFGSASDQGQWDPARPTVCGFGSDARSGAGTGMRTDLYGLVLDHLRESDLLLERWLTRLETALGSRVTEVVGEPQPRIRFVEGPDMFRSKPDCGPCSSPKATTPPPVVDNMTELPSVGPGGVTSSIATDMTSNFDFYRQPV
ncbi:hypothetical protein CDL60_28610 [Roseateles noduli]|nr:hypothetical protein CDL60_28610 [Roseateles noduli]